MTAAPVRTLLVSIAVASLVSVAQAQVGGANEMLSLGVGGGVAVPANNALDAFKPGFDVQGFVRLNLKQLRIAPRLDFIYTKFHIDQAKRPGEAGSMEMFAGVANLQCFVMPAGPVRPYVVAGLGEYNLSGALDDSSTGARFGFDGGAGMTLKLAPQVSGYVEGRLDSVFSRNKSDPVMVFPLILGVVF